MGHKACCCGSKDCLEASKRVPSGHKLNGYIKFPVEGTSSYWAGFNRIVAQQRYTRFIHTMFPDGNLDKIRSIKEPRLSKIHFYEQDFDETGVVKKFIEGKHESHLNLRTEDAFKYQDKIYTIVTPRRSFEEIKLLFRENTPAGSKPATNNVLNEDSPVQRSNKRNRYEMSANAPPIVTSSVNTLVTPPPPPPLGVVGESALPPGEAAKPLEEVEDRTVGAKLGFPTAADVEAVAKRIEHVICKTPLEESNVLSKMCGAKSKTRVFIKHEECQYSGSFKLRGVANHLTSLSLEQKAGGVVTGSTGNHGIAVAYAAKQLGIKSLVYLCENVPELKKQRISQYGGATKVVPGWCLQAQNKARQMKRMYYVPPYNSFTTVEGQATCGLEIYQQMANLNCTIDAVFCCVGGGGLISGISSYLKAKNPKIKVYGASAERTPAMYEALKNDKIVQVYSAPSIADGNGGNLEEGSITFDICKKNLEEIVLVTEEQIKDAVKFALENERYLIEPTGAVALAAFISRREQFKQKNVVVVTCGRNISLETLQTKILSPTAEDNTTTMMDTEVAHQEQEHEHHHHEQQQHEQQQHHEEVGVGEEHAV